jgi:RHS repeat-associated protein
MSEAKLNTVSQATFAYDGDELRIRKTKTSTGALTHYIYDAQGQLLAEMDGATGAAIREYVWLGALPIGYIDRLGSGGASRLFFIHADHLARPQKITDAARATVWDGVFAPFGEIHSITGSIVNVLMFPGQVYDPETGLAQNWHRDYDANSGRYLQSDPIGLEGGINTYAYVGGNPVVEADASGESSKGIKWGPSRKRYRECNKKEMETCEKQCDPDPVDSCKRSQTWSYERTKPFYTEGWKDQGLSCSCKRTEKSYCEKNPATCAGIILGFVGLCIATDGAAILAF